MLEIGLAISAASHAVAAIQKGLALHKDASELTDQFSTFWDARDKIAEARTQSDNTTLGGKVFAKQSVESFALEVALAEHKTKQLEKQLREMFIYSGQAEVYTTMMRVRKQERSRRLITARRKAEQKKFVADCALLMTVLVISISIFGFIVSWLIMQS